MDSISYYLFDWMVIKEKDNDNSDGTIDQKDWFVLK